MCNQHSAGLWQEPTGDQRPSQSCWTDLRTRPQGSPQLPGWGGVLPEAPRGQAGAKSGPHERGVLFLLFRGSPHLLLEQSPIAGRQLQRFPGEEWFSEPNLDLKLEKREADKGGRRGGLETDRGRASPQTRQQASGSCWVGTLPPFVIVREHSQRFPRRQTEVLVPRKNTGAQMWDFSR